LPSKFKVGQEVRFTSNVLGRPGDSGVYTIVRVQPHEHEEREYRIKSKSESYERTARESELQKID
jgi:hypothetical protein